jgi:FkbM family methyltransferase
MEPLMEELDPSFKITYAQNREDIILGHFFKKVPRGFYVDVGAGHPEEDSVTKLFYDKGWRGINVEPIKRVHALLEKKRPEQNNLNIGLSDKSGKLSFREYENYGQSTFTIDMKKEYENSAAGMDKYEDYEVQVDTLANVLSRHKVKHIHFLKIDVEGLEYEVLNGNDWEKYRPEVLCIEANHIVKDWRPLLKDNAYVKIFNDGLNDYYVSKESGKEDFSYEGAFLSSVRPVDYRIAAVIDKEIDRLSAKIEEYISKDIDQSSSIDRLEYEVNALNSTLASYANSTRFLTKALVGRVDHLIEEFIYPSRYRDQLIAPPKNAGIALHNEPSQQIKAINKYDSTYLSKVKTTSHPLRKFTLRTYQIIRHAAMHIIRVGRRLKKKIAKRR